MQNKDLKTILWGQTHESFNLRVSGGRSPWKILQTWIFSTLGYWFSGAWEKLVSKALKMNTNGDS